MPGQAERERAKPALYRQRTQGKTGRTRGSQKEIPLRERCQISDRRQLRVQQTAQTKRHHPQPAEGAGYRKRSDAAGQRILRQHPAEA